MSNTTFYIVRHGESEENVSEGKGKGHVLDAQSFGSNLTDLGVRQAQATAKLLKDVHFDKAISSDFIRAKRTAEIILDGRDLALETTALLRERSRGKIVGNLEKTIAKRLGNIFDELELMTPDEQQALKKEYGIELREDITTKVVAFLQEVAAANPGQTILIVCHGAIMRALLMYFGFGTPEELPAGAVANASFFVTETDGSHFTLKQMHGIEKRVQSVFAMTKEKFALYAAVYILLEKEGKILLLRRHNTGWEDGKYTLPAGHFDGGETVKAAAIREAREETGVEIKEEDLEIVHVLHINTDKEYISYFLKANTWKGEPTNTEPEKSDDMKWFSIDTLPENTLPFIRDVLDDYHAGIMFSEVGFGRNQALSL